MSRRDWQHNIVRCYTGAVGKSCTFQSIHESPHDLQPELLVLTPHREDMRVEWLHIGTAEVVLHPRWPEKWKEMGRQEYVIVGSPIIGKGGSIDLRMKFGIAHHDFYAVVFGQVEA